MKIQRLPIALTAANLALLLLLWIHAGPSVAQGAPGVPAVLRAQRIELVDTRGQVRAQLKVDEGGEAVFRLRDARGTIRVKLGASEDGSGLLLLDGSTEPGVHILAKRGGSTMTLTGKAGQKRVIAP